MTPFGKALEHFAVRRLCGESLGGNWLNAKIDGKSWFVQLRIRVDRKSNNIQLAQSVCRKLRAKENENCASGLVWVWRSLDADRQDTLIRYWLIPLKLVAQINAQLPIQNKEDFHRNIVIKENADGRWVMRREAGPGDPVDVQDCYRTWHLDNEEMDYLMVAKDPPAQ